MSELDRINGKISDDMLEGVSGGRVALNSTVYNKKEEVNLNTMEKKEGVDGRITLLDTKSGKGRPGGSSRASVLNDIQHC